MCILNCVVSGRDKPQARKVQMGPATPRWLQLLLAGKTRQQNQRMLPSSGGQSAPYPERSLSVSSHFSTAIQGEDNPQSPNPACIFNRTDGVGIVKFSEHHQSGKEPRSKSRIPALSSSVASTERRVCVHYHGSMTPWL